MRLGYLCVALGIGLGGCGRRAASPPPSDASVVSMEGLDFGGPLRLSETGLYSDFSARTLSSDVIRYTPRYPLWSDGAEKERFLLLPTGTQIDTSDMDNWVFPDGTKLWKEFSRDGKVIETRLLQKLHDGKDGWFEVAYLWNETHSEAIAVPDGQENALGTSHNVPSQEDCGKCHGNVRDVIIGVSAIQLSAADGRGALSDLSRRGLLSQPPAGEFEVPGHGIVQDALGYMHGNCGHCHNNRSFFEHESVLRLRLSVTDTIAEETPSYKTTIRVKMFHDFGGINLGVVPGALEMSQLYVRMGLRDDNAMPPVCSKVVDSSGRGVIADWINSLPQ